MSAKTTKCETCGATSSTSVCDSCGIDVSNLDDAVRIAYGLAQRAEPQGVLDYCAPCARKTLPAAMGVPPGIDPSAETGPVR